MENLAPILSLINMGVAVGIISGTGRLIWYLSKQDSKLEKNTQDINAAFTKIRDHEETISELKEQLVRLEKN